MKIRLRIGPIPLRAHDIALEAPRAPRRLRGKLAMRDARGPIAELRRGALEAELIQPAHHRAAGLPRLHAPLPRLGGRIERAQLRRNGARILIAELVARLATVGLDQVKPLALGLEVRGNAVPVGPRRSEERRVG